MKALLLSLALPLLAALLAGGCRTENQTRAATSLLGAPLYAPGFEDERRAKLEQDLAAARAQLASSPDDEEAIIWVGRRLAYLGRYEEAIEVYTRGIELYPASYKLLRHRGHRYISTRQLERATADLGRAAELVAGVPDELEPDGAPNAMNIPRSTNQSNIWYHLGLVQYLQGDFEEALESYRACLTYSRVNDDMLCATSHWLYMTLRRLLRESEARAVLAPINEQMDVIENHGYHQLLLMYKGLRDPEELLEGDGDGVQSATVAYGIGNWFLYGGDGTRAFEVFDDILEGEAWAAFGYIAAEAEVAARRSGTPR